ncbi:hypothetical protein Tco_1084919, partial [Tanacetum coccineum]
MPMPDALLTDEIKGAPNYGDYQEHVAKYQQFLDAEHDKAEEGGTIKSSDATKVTKPKEAKDTKPAGDKAPKPTASFQRRPPMPTEPTRHADSPCNTPKIGSQRNVFPGALLHDPIAQVRRERPLT